jgi:membrane-associated phospholipid phosphatase
VYVSVSRGATGADPLTVLSGEDTGPKKPGVVGSFLADEAAIWTSPLHMDGNDALYWGGVAATTAALIVTSDQPVARTTYRFRDDHTWVQTVSPILTQFGQFYVPYGIAVAYCLEGMAFNDDTRVDTGLLAVQAMIHSGIVVQVMKHISGRSRPFVTFDRDKWYGPRMFFKIDPPRGYSPYDSFPSGHTITAFTLATVIAGREQTWVGIVAYSCAGLCGFSRLTQHDHWLSDVFVGGTLGVAIGKFELNRHNQPLAIYPSIGTRSAGLTLELNK